MSLKQVVRHENAPVCDYCDEEVTYYRDSHVRADIVKNNDNDHPNIVNLKSWVNWWREKDIVFGRTRYDFHGECFIKLMEEFEDRKEKSNA